MTWGSQPFDQAGYDAATQKYQTDLASYNNSQNSGAPSIMGYGEDGSAIFGPRGGGSGMAAPTAPDRAQFQGTGAQQATINQTLNPAQQGILNSQNQISQGLLDTGKTALGTAQDTLSKPFDLSSIKDIMDRAYGAQTSRLDPQWAQAGKSNEANLVNQGLRPGMEAYDNAMRDFNQGKNDAYQQATTAAINTMPQTYQLARSEYTQPLDIVNALRTGSQVQNPTFQGFQGSTAAPANYQQASAQSMQNQLGQYNAGVASNNATTQGLTSLAAAALMFSDRRLKSNIRRIGTHASGLPLYSYTIFGRRDIGVMADEARARFPAAVVRHASGYLMVDYNGLR